MQLCLVVWRGQLDVSVNRAENDDEPELKK